MVRNGDRRSKNHLYEKGQAGADVLRPATSPFFSLCRSVIFFLFLRGVGHVTVLHIACFFPPIRGLERTRTLFPTNQMSRTEGGFFAPYWTQYL
uniref:Uncharacterized protein n=1 Tax=Anguilla anguilla TaxID=7936 RepID=A0A0E9X9F1_ANGAN